MTLGLFAMLTVALLAVAVSRTRPMYPQPAVINQRAEHRQ